MTRELRLTFDDDVFYEMEKAKEREEKRKGDKISWIRFILDKALEKKREKKKNGMD